MAIVGPRHPLKQGQEAGRAHAAGLAAALAAGVGAFLRQHSAVCAVMVGVGSVAWGLQQVT